MTHLAVLIIDFGFISHAEKLTTAVVSFLAIIPCHRECIYMESSLDKELYKLPGAMAAPEEPIVKVGIVQFEPK